MTEKTKIIAGMEIQEDVLKLRIEKEQLEQTNNKLLDVINGQDVKIADLEKQIEKMKNWCNCGNYLNCIIKSEEEDFKAGVCHNCTDWELKEIEK